MTAKLIRQLRREARANPKKAGFLALMLVVAIYAWAPVAMNWAAPEPLAAAPPAPSAVGQPGPQMASTATSAHSPVPLPPWQHVAAWMDGDPLMRPGWGQEHLAYGRNPFAPDQSAQRAAGSRPDDEAPGNASPAELGMVLSSTVIGPLRRTAMINGKAYPQGAEVQAADGTRFVLSRVEPRRVVLSRGGRHFELAIVRQAAGRIAIGAAN
ncbi:MAG: hypothetical protein WD403_12260 [Pirellulales bacterium]